MLGSAVRNRLLALWIALIAALALFAANPSTAQDTAQPAEPVAESDAPTEVDRSATGGAQTLEDILRRQRGEDVPLDQGSTGAQPLPEGAPGSLATQGGASDSAFWRAIRQGESFSVSIPDKNAAMLVQDEGKEWLALREGPLLKYTGWALAGMLILLVLFFVFRGRIRIDAGMSGITVQRFDFLERFAHWLLAVSFIILGITGLALLAGREALTPALDWANAQMNGEAADPNFGKEIFGSWAPIGKWLHNHLSWAFMLGLVLIFVLWVFRNLPTWTDVKWLLKGGGLFSKGVHPSSRKFNAGQKILFWLVILLGGSVSASGLMLMFPYELPMFAKTFEWINLASTSAGRPMDLETELTPIQEMQFAQLWHTIVGAAMIVIILGHIYIGSIGMQGAFSAMGSGKVDLNWAEEHHDLWVKEMHRKGVLTDRQLGIVPSQRPDRADGTPAE